MIDRAGTRHGTDIEEDANVRLENRAKCVEEPAMGVDLLLIFLLQAKDDLHGNNTFLRAFDLVRWGDGDCRGDETDGITSVGDTHSAWYTRIYVPPQASR